MSVRLLRRVLLLGLSALPLAACYYDPYYYGYRPRPVYVAPPPVYAPPPPPRYVPY